MVSRSRRNLPSAYCRDNGVEFSAGCFLPGVGRSFAASPGSHRRSSAWSRLLAGNSEDRGLAQMPPGIAAERINVDVLGGAILQCVIAIHSASPLSPAQRNPI